MGFITCNKSTLNDFFFRIRHGNSRTRVNGRRSQKLLRLRRRDDGSKKTPPLVRGGGEGWFCVRRGGRVAGRCRTSPSPLLAKRRGIIKAFLLTKVDEGIKKTPSLGQRGREGWVGLKGCAGQFNVTARCPNRNRRRFRPATRATTGSSPCRREDRTRRCRRR